MCFQFSFALVWCMFSLVWQTSTQSNIILFTHTWRMCYGATVLRRTIFPLYLTKKNVDSIETERHSENERWNRTSENIKEQATIQRQTGRKNEQDVTKEKRIEKWWIWKSIIYHVECFEPDGLCMPWAVWRLQKHWTLFPSHRFVNRMILWPVSTSPLFIQTIKLCVQIDMVDCSPHSFAFIVRKKQSKWIFWGIFLFFSFSINL